MKIGETLDQRFELRATLGAGGLGEVFLARDLRARRDVAVKVLDAARCPAAARRRYTELVESAMRSQLPGVALPRVHVGLSATPPFVAGDALAGDDLAALRGRLGALPWPRALAIVRAAAVACAALTRATGAGHRALKPGNVRVGAGDEVHVLDFGVAELGVQPTPPRADGTFAEYRAPEQLAGAAGDARSDVFTLGVLLFELATGVHPFAGPSAFKAANKSLMQPTPRPAELAPHVALPAQLEALLLRALARAPTDRHRDAGELAEHLGLVLRAPGALRAATAAPPQPGPPAPPQPASAESHDDSETALALPVLRVARPLARPPASQPSAPPTEDGPPLLGTGASSSAMAVLDASSSRHSGPSPAALDASSSRDTDSSSSLAALDRASPDLADARARSLAASPRRPTPSRGDPGHPAPVREPTEILAPLPASRPAPSTSETTDALPAVPARPTARLAHGDDDATIPLTISALRRSTAPGGTLLLPAEPAPDDDDATAALPRVLPIVPDSGSLSGPLQPTPLPPRAPARTGLTASQWTLIAVNVALLGVIIASLVWLAP